MRSRYFFGVRLGRAQRVGIDHIELDVMAVQLEIGAHQLHQFVEALFICQQLGRELLVEQRAAGADVVHLGG